MYGRVSYNKENIYINNQRIIGITNFDASVDYSKSAINAAGAGFIGQVSESEIPSNFSFTKFVTTGDDALLNLIGEDLNGKFLYESSNGTGSNEWRAISGKLTSYELTCSVGNIPESKFSFEISKEAEFTDTSYAKVEEFSESVTVARPGDLIISGSNNLFTNRLQSLTFSFDIPYQRIYFIGGSGSSIFLLNDPIEVILSMEFDLDFADNEFSNFTLCQSNFSGVFTFNRCGNNIKQFKIMNAELIDYSVDGSVGNNAKFNCTYRTYVNEFSQLKGLLI